MWHHAAATFDGTTLAVYLDGNLEASDDPGFHPRSDSMQGVGLGAMITTDDFGSMPSYLGRFDGVIDEARVWDHARTIGEIQANKDNELTSGTGLVARWGLNEGAGTTVGDSIASPLPPTAPSPAPATPGWLASSRPSAATPRPMRRP